MAFFEILERIIGHVAWPLVFLVLILTFREEIRVTLGRIRNAKIKGVEINLEDRFRELKKNAIEANVTIAYASKTFSKEILDNISHSPEWIFIKSWQEIENLMLDYYESISEKGVATKTRSRISIREIISYLRTNEIINDDLAGLVDKLRSTRNQIVHSPNAVISRGEALEWLGIAHSVKDRLAQKIKG